LLKDKQRDVSETETFQSSKLKRDRDETESLGAFKLETETRPRVSSFPGFLHIQNIVRLRLVLSLMGYG
jgi:hypothetical protein